MKRREVIALFGSAAAWPLAAHAQQRGMVARIGYLAAGSHDNLLVRENLNAFRRGLRDLGHFEARTSLSSIGLQRAILTGSPTSPPS